MRYIRLFALLSAVFMLSMAVSGDPTANAQGAVPSSSGLLGPAEGTLPERAAGHVGAAQARFVGVDLDLLAGSGDRPGASAAAGAVRVDLFDGSFVTVPRQRIDFAADGSYVWHGEAAGPADGQVTVSVKDGVATGTIVRAGRTYQLLPVGGGVHELIEIDGAKMPEALEPLAAGTSTDSGSTIDGKGLSLDSGDTIDGTDVILADSGGVIDVLVVYTAAARAAQGGTAAMETLVNLAVSETNTAYANSGITTTINLAHMVEDSYVETGNFNTDLTRLRSKTDGYMDGVHALRDAHDADQVTLITTGTASCGIAYVMTTLSTNFESSAFSVVARTCATGYYSFSHEIGHNQGSMHDRANAGGQGVYPYGYGFQAPSNNFRTIMAYNCPSGCPRVQHFSNPSVNYNGEPTGIDHNTDPANSADNHLSINNTAWTVANFRVGTPATPPAAPSSLTATEDGTTIDLAWTDNASDEDGFEVERADGGVGNWSVIATLGPNTTAYADTGLPISTTYDYRVLAYNTGGDSAYSNTATATTASSAPPVVRVANGETAVSGTVSGTYVATNADGGAVESIRERESGGRPANRYSYLEHRWSIDVAAGDTVTLFLDAYMDASTDGDEFTFAYSTGGSYTDMMTISNTSPGAAVAYPLPSSTSGAITVRVLDTNRTSGNRALDTVYIDHLYVESQAAGGGSPPAAPSSLAATAINSGQIDLDWTDNATDEFGFRIERRTGGGAWSEIGTAAADATTYSDTTVAASTTYDYRVMAYNGSGDSAWSNIASATTPAGNPITLTAVGYKVKGKHTVDLTWSGASGSNVDVKRDGVIVATPTNNGAYTDNIGTKGGATYLYKVCETGSSNCSDEVQVVF